MFIHPQTIIHVHISHSCQDKSRQLLTQRHEIYSFLFAHQIYYIMPKTIQKRKENKQILPLLAEIGKTPSFRRAVDLFITTATASKSVHQAGLRSKGMNKTIFFSSFFVKESDPYLHCFCALP